jgi:diguanylate cyclase (GGDEF)-like protein
VAIASRDEVGVLARAFNAMSDELAQSHERLQASYRTISQQADQLREQAIRDALTGLYNRRYFDERAAWMYQQSIRYGHPMAVAIGDVDNFKTINDKFSHAIGDAVLRELSDLLRQHLRSSDLAARYGGEEFVFAFPQTGIAEAAECCERLRQIIAAHPWRQIHPDLAVTISLGVAAEQAPGGIEPMLAAADHQLYAAKLMGRNRVSQSGDDAAVATRQLDARTA